MIRLIFVGVVFCFHVCASEYCLIFVHLGEKIPSCIFTTMKQARYLNQDCDIYLLADQKAFPYFQKAHLDFFAEERIFLVDSEKIPISEERKQFHQVHRIDPSISEGLWVYAIERFFILYEFLQKKGLKNSIHLESDTMLYVDLEELLPIFTTSGMKLAAPFQSLVGCIPCFVFVQDAESLASLIDHILSEMRAYQGTRAHIDVNDMQLLASFYRKFGLQELSPLPSLMGEYRHYHSKRKSRFLLDNRTDLKFLSLNESLFSGFIFDAAGLGVWFNGNNRKYSPKSGPGTVHARLLFYPRFFRYFWGKDRKGRRVPYLSFRGKDYRIVNLHFHSKMPEDYASYLF
jgi:hypothetical protein